MGWKDEQDKKYGGGDDGAKAANSESEIVAVAIKQLPAEIRERLEKLFEEGLLKEGDLDLRSVTVFASLNEGLQTRVMNHMENERIYVANARSKSGFLIATCDKAKTGCLDARGLGAIDPWRTALVAMATPKQRVSELKPERDWLDQHDDGSFKITVELGEHDKELGVPSVTVELPPTDTSTEIKEKLVAMGLKSLAANKMKFHADGVGFLKETNSFAYYNLLDGVTLKLSSRKRAGSRYKKDHSVANKRAKTQSMPAPEPAKLGMGGMGGMGGLPKLGGMGGLPGLPGLPGFPGLGGMSMPGMSMPKLPSLPGLPGLGGTVPSFGPPGGMRPPSGMPGLPGLPGFPGLGGLPKGGMLALPAGGFPGLGGLPGIGGLGGGLGLPGKAGGLDLTMLGKGGMSLPGLPPMGADPKEAAMMAMKLGGSKAGGLPMPGMA